MGWTTYHSRSDVLRAAVDELEARRDGALPDVVAPFRDTLDLVGALHFRWHHRLVSCLEQRLDGRTDDLAEAVVEAWADAARSTPGLRTLIDAQLADPVDAGVGAALRRATVKERQLLAAMAGLAGRLDQHADDRAVRLGGELEQAARRRWAATPEPAPQRVAAGSASFVRRLRAVLAA